MNIANHDRNLGVDTDTLVVCQGEFVVSDRPETCLVTVLGSCIGACIFDPRQGIGGLNHFLLPHGGGQDAGSLRYGANAMELLINAILRGGGARPRLVAKLFGGARMMGEFSDFGRSNAEFALTYLRDEGIPCISQSLNGNLARRVRFWPHGGRAQQLFVRRCDAPITDRPRPTLPQTVTQVEFF